MAGSVLQRTTNATDLFLQCVETVLKVETGENGDTHGIHIAGAGNPRHELIYAMGRIDELSRVAFDKKGKCLVEDSDANRLLTG